MSAAKCYRNIEKNSRETFLRCSFVFTDIFLKTKKMAIFYEDAAQATI
jgi:hypothetical protein